MKYINTNCSSCNKIIVKRIYDVKAFTNNFCDKDCHRKFKMTGIIKPCANCGKDVYRSKSSAAKSKSGDFFCNKTCATIVNNSRHKKWINHPQYKNGMRAYRSVALEFYGEKCSNNNCPLGIVKTKMLDVHHIDSNRKNNSIENLEVLCVWCHALKTRKNW